MLSMPIYGNRKFPIISCSARTTWDRRSEQRSIKLRKQKKSSRARHFNHIHSNVIDTMTIDLILFIMLTHKKIEIIKNMSLACFESVMGRLGISCWMIIFLLISCRFSNFTQKPFITQFLLETNKICFLNFSLLQNWMFLVRNIPCKVRQTIRRNTKKTFQISMN